MITLTQLKKVNSIEQLEDLCIGSNVQYEIGGRGGYVGYYNESISIHLKVARHLLPSKFGAYTNYLGGGMRGAITTSTFNTSITGRKAQLLTALAEACKRAYQNAEDEAGMNDEEDEDGETNWDAKATNAARRAGIVSAY